MRSTALAVWQEMGMDRLRAQAVADVDAEWEAGRLRWRDVKRLIESFPKRGQLDVLEDGMDDEGDPDEIQSGAQLWDDREDVSDDGDDRDGSALAEPLAPQEAVGVCLSLAQQQLAGYAESRLRHLADIKDRAAELHHPRLLIMLDGMMNQLRRETLGSQQQDVEVGAALRAKLLSDEERKHATHAVALAAAQGESQGKSGLPGVNTQSQARRSPQPKLKP